MLTYVTLAYVRLSVLKVYIALYSFSSQEGTKYQILKRHD